MLTVEPATLEWVLARFNKPLKGFDKTVELWKVKHDGVPIMVVGVVRKDLVGWAEVWVILTDAIAYHKSALRAARRMVGELRNRYAGLIAYTAPGRDERFAKFFGFKELGRVGDFVRFEL